jgi:hypothetical protein
VPCHRLAFEDEAVDWQIYIEDGPSPLRAWLGWLLVAMGLAQCGAEDRLWRGLYLATAGLLLFHSELSWAGIVLDSLP